MVDDEARIGVAVDQRRARIHVAPAQYVDRKVVLYGRAQDPNGGANPRPRRSGMCSDICSAAGRLPRPVYAHERIVQGLEMEEHLANAVGKNI